MRSLLEHMLWADDRVEAALLPHPTASPEALELYAHVLGAEQIWLARIRGGEQGPVWPDPNPAGLGELRRVVREGYAGLLATLEDGDIDREVSYTNSAGLAFESTIGDILHHVFLHGAYHRGQVALLMRDVNREPAPTDYIAFVRGTPAATRADAERADAERAGGGDPPSA